MKNPLKLYCLNQEFKTRLIESRTRLYRIAYSWCHEHPLAEDLVQETLTKALKNSNQLRDHAAMDSWLFGILNNNWRDYLRRKKDLDNIDDVVLKSPLTPERQFERQEITTLVRKHMEELTIGQRQVLSLVDLQGFSYDEVAKALDIPVGTVMSRLSRARKQLAESLLEYQPVNNKETTRVIRRII
ncbi:MAG: RNA polymerase sigma factor [Gammaproteobacteria bacterium]|nr:RNA polymerase sigma factor [Gammaproteobacteria bacterium]MDH5652510.1 RNA polymerase sigma factor [Gammaproteobacteria bacterium]